MQADDDLSAVMESVPQNYTRNFNRLNVKRVIDYRVSISTFLGITCSAAAKTPLTWRPHWPASSQRNVLNYKGHGIFLGLGLEPQEGLFSPTWRNTRRTMPARATAPDDGLFRASGRAERCVFAQAPSLTRLLANGNFYLFEGLDANSLLLNMYMPELKRIRDTAAAGDLDRLCAHTSTSIASRS
jgi:hypothetical protein